MFIDRFKELAQEITKQTRGAVDVSFYAAGELPYKAPEHLRVTGRGLVEMSEVVASMAFGDAPPLVPAATPPPFYAQLGHERPAGVLLEAPWHHLLFTRMLATHQQQHGQPVLVSYLRGYPVNDPRLRFATVVRPDPTLFLRSRARYLVLHLDPGREERALDPHGALPFATGKPASSETRPVIRDPAGSVTSRTVSDPTSTSRSRTWTRSVRGGGGS